MKTLILIAVIALSGCAAQEHRSTAFMSPEEYRAYSDERQMRHQRNMQMMGIGAQMLTPQRGFNCYTVGNSTSCR